MDLTEHERTLVERIEAGDKAVFGPDERQKGEPSVEIRADVLRRVVLGLSIDGAASGVRLAPARVEVIGAIVTGALDLSNGRRPDGGPLGAIILRNCVLKEEVGLRAADIATLTLKDCRITRINAEAVHVRGPVDLSGVASAEADGQGTGCMYGEAAEGRAQVDLRGARIEGDLTAGNATFCAPPYDPDQDYSNRKSPSALGLVGADIHGSLMLQPGFRAFGGVDASQVRIGGSVFMNGAHVCADGPYSLRFDLAVVERSIMLGGLFQKGATAGQPFISEGVVRLYNARVHGELWLAGADLRPHRKPRRESDPDQTIALNGFMAEIGKAVRCFEGSEAGFADLKFRAKGVVLLRMARLGAFYASGASFDGLGGYALEFGGAQVDGDLEISSRTELFGGLYAPDLRVSQAVRLSELKVNAPQEKSAGNAGDALGDIIIFNAAVGGDLVFRDVEGRQINGAGARIAHSATFSAVRAAQIYLSSVAVGENLLVEKSRFTIVSGDSASLALGHSQISGSLNLNDVDLGSQLFMQNCKIGGNLRLDDVRVRSTGWCIDAMGSEVGGEFSVQASASGRIRLSSMSVGGETRLNGLKFGERGSLDFKGTVFSGGLTVARASGPDKPTLSIARDARRTGHALAARAVALPFYPGWKLLELRYPEGVAAALWNGRRQVIDLNGLSPPIHEFNQRHKIVLNDATVRAYLEFFSAHVWGDEGAFRMIRAPQELSFWGIPADAQEYRQALSGAVTRDGDTWRTKALIDYGGNLFESEFRIFPGGMVEMVEDRPLKAQPLSWRRTLYGGGLRYANPWPGAVWLRGPWRTLTGAEDGRARDAVAGAFAVRDLRARDLAFYPGWLLLQAIVEHPKGRALQAWLWDGWAKAISLSGEAQPIHAFNARSPSPLRLETDEQIKDYLRFFCAHVWGDGGPFLLIDDADEMPFQKDAREDRAGLVKPLLVERADGETRARATVAYAGHLFHSVFRVHPNGAVDMLEDQVADIPEAEMALAFDKPFVFPAGSSARHAKANDWPVEGALPNMQAVSVPAAVRKGLPQSRPVRLPVDLTGARAAMFDDDFGRAWGDDVVKLKLGGFSYEHLDTGAIGDEPSSAGAKAQYGGPTVRDAEQRGRKRKDWLRLQFDDTERGPDRLNAFDSQPHAQLAHVYRRAGRLDDARVIDHDRLHIEGRLAARDWQETALGRGWRPVVGLVLALAVIAGVLAGVGMWPQGWTVCATLAGLLALVIYGPWMLNALYHHLFGHGLYTRNALATFASCLLLGWVGAEVANRGTVFGFVRFGDPAYDQVYGGAKASILVRDVTNTPDVIVQPDEPNAPPRLGWLLDEVRGENFVDELPCASEIQPFLYATDVFIPLVDLRQESQCRPRGDAVGWNVAKALYALLGWIVTSLTILTVSGVLRRRSQAPE
ncbi:MAG: hypothetical protein NW200_05090 [Hyphomonadaceae bacterium]|nr:hypothetical protein [Hyphomonadaceae bacterium]